ncbi:uncharacterized protein LOC124911298 isoform X2 [Impatiens glandulifera]|uniref:uncharacterized protein LOC124911298 isoform X2 n=1 Tax=Impatiens glandulifera TaxID=253017 RepID=UPI001FB0F000|nr:uncharacterized protein LOC124911298 isoform X2 [Impatiens glandulifera]
MVTTRGSSDQRKWQEAFHKLLQLLKTQQTQIESFVNERKILEDRMNLQHNRWQSEVNLLMDQLSQEKKKSTVQEMSRHVDSTKAELLQMMKQKEAFIYKTKLDRTVDDLSDFRSMYDNYLRSQQSSNKDNMSNHPEVLALVSERDFVWNQFKKMDSKFVTQLKNKNSEIEDANSKIKKLESMNKDKDDLILKLQTDLAKFDSMKKKQKMKKGEDVSTSRPRTRSSYSKVSQISNTGGNSLKRSRKSMENSVCRNRNTTEQL